jgi:hypothetical protein
MENRKILAHAQPNIEYPLTLKAKIYQSFLEAFSHILA